MSTATEKLTVLSAKVEDITAALRALRDAMLAEQTTLTPAGQAALDTATTYLDALDTETEPTP